VVPGLDDNQFGFGGAVHQSVLVIDPPGPETRQIAAQRLGLASALERVRRASSISRTSRANPT
jgi:hypothetical protein